MNLIMYVVILILLAHGSYGVIYYLNGSNTSPFNSTSSLVFGESEYSLMPPIYKLDSYNDCLHKPNDAYCSISFNLVSDEPNKLLEMIKDYSEHTVTHYNHTKMRYGLCVTRHCHIQDKTAVSEGIIETCLNESFWKNYQLKTKVKHFNCYSLSDEINIDAGDVITGVLVFAIIMLNVIGSLYDFCNTTKSGEKSILLVFSIQRNCKRLIFNNNTLDQHLLRLKCIDGLRCICVYGVIMVHCFWPYLIAVDNAHGLEMVYQSLPSQILLNGSIMIQTFIVISGFLLAYKMKEIDEKEQLSWNIVPKGLLLRYVRLTPVYALVVALSATWLKFVGPGPLWEISAEPSLLDCRKRWWLNLLYLNNYVYDSQCMVQAWYLATDMQLFCLGLIACVVLKTRFRKTLFLVLFSIAIILPAAHTYIRDFNPHMLISPGEARSLFKSEPTFNEVYKTTHGNLASYVIGLALGYFIYWLQQKNIDVRKYQRLRYIYWAVLPLIVGTILSGAVFYRDAPRDPLYIRVLYAAFAKPVLGALIAILITGIIFKLEKVYRTVLECSLWTVPSKLSYCVYIVHFPLLRIYLALQTSLLYLSTYNLLAMSVCFTIVSYIAAVPLFLLVEAPFTGLTKHFTTRKVDVHTGCHKKIENSNTYL